MSHDIYNTQGIVLESFPVGEADKFFRIFTRELGMIEAIAQGVRKMESKNRYGLQDFSVSDFSLVRGKEVWRITGVDPKENLFFGFTVHDELLMISEVFVLLKQLIHGEDKNEELFDLIMSGVKFLKNNCLKNGDFENFELLMKMKILYNLGHFEKNNFFDLSGADLSLEFLVKIGKEKEKIKKEIQKAIGETQF